MDPPKIIVKRILPGNDLYETIKNEIALSVKNLYGKCSLSISTCVGSLKNCVIRLAGATPTNEKIVTIPGPLEIVSLVGTVTDVGIHVHISVADSEGNTKGGHLMPGSLVDTTAEIVLIDIYQCSGIFFTREQDPNTGFKELVVK
ncbi:DNA-binding protein [Histomonas meleagridis]|uniref:DNA-binding protein n=1 Tax=Histomonas meleagridis TaxID=135588 RepID=UPI003559D010|nr:DNA-binding protein [Histomonas meleagridis]KAH0804989.1 DNA-binding protein [Histomonas meleagridis]